MTRDPGSPRLLLALHPAETSAAVLSAARSLEGAGLLDLRRRITSGAPILETEMFTNDWFDGFADHLLRLLTAWERQGTRFELMEVPPGEGPEAGEQITLDQLRSIIEAGDELPCPERN